MRSEAEQRNPFPRRREGSARPPLLVSAAGEGTHQSICAALDEAEPGQEIHIRPGVYREALVLSRPVTLVGEGPVERIVIESSGADCIRMEADSATVRGLTLRCLS